MAGKVCPQCATEYELDQRFCSKEGAALVLIGGDAEDLTGRVIGGRYQVLRRLGEGGMGAVYLAERLRLKKRRAVKVIRPAMAGDLLTVTRFSNEAMNASRVENEYVAQVHDSGEAEDGLLYLAMEYVDGESLASILKREHSMSLARALPLLRQIAEALAAAYCGGGVHCRAGNREALTHLGF